MGTSVEVSLWLDDEEEAAAAINAVMDEMQRINLALSPYREDSELSRINRLAAQSPQAISDELVFLLDKSLYYGQLTEGAFDLTFASLGRYYNYREGISPSEEQRKALLPAINFRHVELDRAAKTVHFRHPQVYIDLGGIAKGYAVDRAVAILRDRGVEHATVSAGGDSRVLGDKRGQPWIIGIKNPRQRADDPETLIRMPLADVAVSTSGDYERFFIDEKSGERIHHILNPKSGISAKGIVSVTVIGDRGVDTDPLSTSVFVMGIEKGLALINRLPGFDCVIIDSHGQAHYSLGLTSPGETYSDVP